MKKFSISIMVLITLLCGCTKKAEIHPISDFQAFPDTKIVEVECILGSGSSVILKDSGHIAALIDTLLKIRVDVNNARKGISIDDGGIAFFFIDSDNKKTSYCFCTSEYYEKNNQYYPVENRSLVNELCSMSSDFAQMENEMIRSITIDNREIRIEYEDNGCEARNVMLLYPEWNNQELTVDGVYSIVNISESEDGLIILCMCGDFYSHEEPVDYLLKIQNDELVLLTIE